MKRTIATSKRSTEHRVATAAALKFQQLAGLVLVLLIRLWYQLYAESIHVLVRNHFRE